MRKMILGLGWKAPSTWTVLKFSMRRTKFWKPNPVAGGSSMNSSYREWTKRLQFEEPENMQKLRFRMIYKVPVEPVSVPVDVKLGMRGEIREKKK